VTARKPPVPCSQFWEGQGRIGDLPGRSGTLGELAISHDEGKVIERGTTKRGVAKEADEDST
jgi:hypothetical protein